MTGRPKIVLLGMLTRMPVGGVVWLMHQYVVGFERLGYDVYYVEAHGQFPTNFMEHQHDSGTKAAASFIAGVMQRFGMSDRWAFHALHDDGRCYGMSDTELGRLYREAALILNLHGGTVPREEHARSGRLVYMGTDPVHLELELHRGEQQAIDYLEPHVAFFTWGLNYGNPDCKLPWCERFPFVPSPPPVVLDLWQGGADPGAGAFFTTVGNWRQEWHDVTFEGEIYTWSKHHEFLKVISLPGRVAQGFELALGRYDDDDRRLLERHGWRVRSALDVSTDPTSYRDYVRRSRGEFTVAKDQNVRLRTGWFSERSATYLASGRPVIQQDTGFGNAFPTGEGVFGFADLDGAVAAVDEINGDYGRHRRAAVEVAREYFNYDVVLADILDRLGLGSRPSAPRPGAAGFLTPPLPLSLDLAPVSRRPLRLSPETAAAVQGRPVPRLWPRDAVAPAATVVMVTFNGLTVTRMALESLLADAAAPAFEVIVVDNASTDGTRRYLSVLAARNRNVKLILNETNRGFAAANNQGLSESGGEILVMMNNDTIVTPGWLAALSTHASGPRVGLVGPQTNRCGNEAEVATTYRTYGELLDFAQERPVGGSFDVDTSIMFCTAMHRSVFEELGPLDERFGRGMFEDDDYSMRARQAGLKVLCAGDVFVHHFGEASFGDLVGSGAHGELFRLNKRQFEEKWGSAWVPAVRRPDPAYQAAVATTRRIVETELPDTSSVLVVSRGDEELLAVPNKSMNHFPANRDGTYAGHHPASAAEAIDELEELRSEGAGAIVFPAPYLWWLDFYADLREHLNSHYARLVDCEACVIYAL